MLPKSNHEETPLITGGIINPSNVNNYQSATSQHSFKNIWTRNEPRITKREQWSRTCGHGLRKCKTGSANCIDWTYIGNTSYDIINIVITIADIITDTLVIYSFYQKNEMTFFWIGVTIIIFAQICYAIAFWVEYVDKDNYMRSFCWFIIALIFSPFLSFVFFFTTDKNRCLSRIFTEYIPGITLPSSRREQKQENTGSIKKWVESKSRKHAGFKIESVCEAFPQV